MWRRKSSKYIRPGFQEAAAAEEAAREEDVCGAGGPGGVRSLLLPLHVRGQGGQVQEALCEVGKLDVQPCINAVTPGSLFHIEDQLTHRRFLCDTGASYSILPHQSSAAASGPPLLLKCWGERELTLTFNNKQYKWIFLLADVNFAIIGIDFLKHFKLVVDAAAGQLIDTWRSS